MIAMPPEFYDYAFKIVLITSVVIGAVSLGVSLRYDERFADFLDKMFDFSDDS